jgi:vitamin B12 transporter
VTRGASAWVALASAVLAARGAVVPASAAEPDKTSVNPQRAAEAEDGEISDEASENAGARLGKGGLSLPDETSDDAAPEASGGHLTRVRAPRPEADQVLGREALRRHAAADLGQVLAAEPGLRVVRLGGLGAFASLAIRGATAEQTAVILDGVPLNGADGAPVDLSTLPLGPLAVVEVHRGFLPARFGVPSMGGGLALRTLPPPETAHVDGEVGAGSFGTALGRAHVGARKVSLHADGLLSAGDFAYRDDAGTRFTDADDVTRTRRNNATALGAVLGRAAWAARGLSLRALHLTTASERGLPGLGVHPTTRSRLGATRHVTGLSGRLEAASRALELAVWHVSARSVWRDPLGELGPATPPTTVLTTTPGAALTASQDLGEAARAAVHLGWRLEALRGGVAPDRHLLSAGLSLGAEVGPLGLSLESQGVAAVGEGVAGDAHRVAARLPLGARQSLTLTLGRTFRLPSLHERFGTTGLLLGNPSLRPERGHGLEVAWRAGLGREGALSLAVNAFARWHEDLIQLVQNAQNVARPENVASARMLGGELEAGWRPRGPLDARLVASLLDARDTSDLAARRGRYLPLRPRWSVGLRAGLKAALDATGSDHAALDLELDLLAPNALDPANLVMTRPRAALGLSARVVRGPVTVLVSAHNVLGSAVQDLAGFPLPGLSAFATLRYNP